MSLDSRIKKLEQIIDVGDSKVYFISIMKNGLYEIAIDNTKKLLTRIELEQFKKKNASDIFVLSCIPRPKEVTA